MTRRRYRLIAAFCIAFHLGACTYYEQTGLNPRVVIEGERPSKVRVMRTDGIQVEVPAPVIRADSITSGEPCDRVFRSDGQAVCRTEPPAIALDEVRWLQVPRTNVIGTAAAIVVFPVVFAVTAVALGCATGEDDFFC